MTAIPTSQSPPISPAGAGRTPHRLSLERYHAMIETGFLTENDQVELIFGQLIDTLPVGNRHRRCVNRINRLFVTRFGEAFECNPQNPVRISPNSEPEPDYAVCDTEAVRGYREHALPEAIHLLIEVSDTTLDYDRSVKAALYALAGVREYWIINLQSDQLEIHTLPNRTEGGYDSVRRFGRGVAAESPFFGPVTLEELLGE